jgi:hypothetical protein
MKKEDIKKLARNKNFIPGIYNYCDRWCERCFFTARCMNFAMTWEYSTDPEASDITNEKFWQSLSEIFHVTREMLEESAEELGIDLDAIDFEESSRSEIGEASPKDSDGSAKVALIGIDRSMAAWRGIYDYFPFHRDQILAIIVHLDRLRNRVEKIFPQARNFIRPGFDEKPLTTG